MTVRELISELQIMPLDKQVVIHLVATGEFCRIMYEKDYILDQCIISEKPSRLEIRILD